MRKAIVVLLLLGSWLHSYAQNATELLPVKVDAKWGYINSSGTMIIPPIYDAAGYFDLMSKARVVKNGRVQMLSYKDGKLIDMENGRVEQYDDLKMISENLVAYRIGTKWGLANWKGEKLLSCTYHEIEKRTFKDKSIVVARKDDSLYVVDANGALLTNKKYKEVKLAHNAMAVREYGKWGLLGYDGKELVECNYTAAYEKTTNYWSLYRYDRLFIYSYAAKRMITHTGAIDFKPVPGNSKYLYITSDKGVGLLSSDGKELVPAEYDNIRIRKNYLYVYLETKMGVYSLTGEKLIDAAYHQIEDFQQHVALVREDRAWGLVNDKGKVIAPPIYRQIELVDNTAKCKKTSTELDVYTISDGGDLQGISEFDNVVSVSSYYRQTYARNISTGTTQVYNWQAGWFRIYNSIYLWGYRDSNLMEVIEPEFSRVQDFPEHGFAVVEVKRQEFARLRMGKTMFASNTKYGIISTKTYEYIYPPVFAYIDMEPMFKEDYAYTRALLPDGRFVVLTKDGARLKTRYAYIGKQVDGMSKFTIKGVFNRVSQYELLKDKMPYGTAGDLIEDISMDFRGSFGWAYRLAGNRFRNITPMEAEGTKENHVLEIAEAEWGYIGRNGRIKIKPKYTNAFNFHGSSAIALINGNYGLLDTSGNTKLPFKYQKIDFLPNSDSQLYQISTHNPSYGIIDSLGNVVVPIDYRRVWDVHNGVVKYRHPTSGYGYINVNGGAISDVRFRNINDFMGNYATVKVGRDWMFMDREGNMVRKLDYINVDAFSEGLAAVFYNHKYGYINEEGKVEISSKYKRANPFKDGYAIVSKNGKKFGYIDTKGNWIHKPKYIYTDDFDEQGLAVVKSSKGHALINKQGDVILKPKYKNIYIGDNGLVTVKKGSNSYLYNINSDELTDLGERDVQAFKNGYAVYEQGGKKGIIAVNGDTITSAVYSECTNVYKDRYAVRDANTIYILSLDGDTVYSREYARLRGEFNGDMILVSTAYSGYMYISVDGENSFERQFERAEPFSNGIARVFYNDKWGLINNAGLELIDAKYDKIFDFKSGYAKVSIAVIKGVADREGNLVFEPEYEHVNYISLGIFRVEKANQVGYITRGGKWVWKLQN